MDLLTKHIMGGSEKVNVVGAPTGMKIRTLMSPQIGLIKGNILIELVSSNAYFIPISDENP